MATLKHVSLDLACGAHNPYVRGSSPLTATNSLEIKPISSLANGEASVCLPYRDPEMGSSKPLAHLPLKAMHMKSDWFVFQPGDDEATVHSSKRLAVRDAQYRGCTDRRPKKIRAGLYELFGCGGHQYFVVSQPMMKANFLQLMEQAYADTQ